MQAHIFGHVDTFLHIRIPGHLWSDMWTHLFLYVWTHSKMSRYLFLNDQISRDLSGCPDTFMDVWTVFETYFLDAWMSKWSLTSYCRYSDIHTYFCRPTLGFKTCVRHPDTYFWVSKCLHIYFQMSGHLDIFRYLDTILIAVFGYQDI